MSEDFPAHLAGFQAGSRLAGYRLEAQIGAGGMAAVFRARDERLGRLVALKILTPALAADGTFRRRFIAESRAAAAVDDPHIIPVYEAGEADGVLFIAMRFVMGGDLGDVINREGALTPGRAAAFISPVASALDAAHRAGLVHRDVKPGNILVDARSGRPDHVYLSDFGVSKGAILSVSLTGAGKFVGTPAYSAPEQAGGLAVDGRADQYALACVAYQLLTGSRPFEHLQGMAVLLAHQSAPPPSLSERRPDLPRAAGEVLTRALSKTPERRYGSCQEFGEALREALRLPPYNSSGTAPAPAIPAVSETVTETVTGTARTRRRRLPLIAAGAVLAATAIVPFVLPGSPGGQRGSIVTSDGVRVAESTPSNDAYKSQRTYPHGAEYAAVTGYDSLHSQAGLEYYENSALKNGDVTLTINSRAQDAAWNALRSTASGKRTSISAPIQLSLPQSAHVLTNRDDQPCGNNSGQASLQTAFAESCDTAFGSLGLSLGAPALATLAGRFGMNDTTLRIPMPVARSSYMIPAGQALTASSAIGKYTDTVTPLQEAMFAAAIANRGTLMRPYLIKQDAARTTAPAVLSRPVMPAVAGAVGQLMLATVQDSDGTAYEFNTAAAGVTVACATGTAQDGANDTGLGDAVVTCYAPYQDPQIAVGVVLQGDGYGAAAAAPVAIQTIKAYLASRR